MLESVMLPQGTLVGANQSQFNLYPQTVQGADFARPALFYFVSGGNPSWKELLGNVELRKSEIQDEKGSVAVEGRDGWSKYTFVLNEKGGYIQRISAHENGKLSYELTIADYAKSPADRGVRVADAPLLTVRTVADRLGFVKPDGVLALIHRGDLPAVNVSAGPSRPTWRIDPADLAAFLERR